MFLFKSDMDSQNKPHMNTNPFSFSWPPTTKKSERILKQQFKLPMDLIRMFIILTNGSISREEFGYSILNDACYAKSYTTNYLIKIGIPKIDAENIYEYCSEWIDEHVSTPEAAAAFDLHAEGSFL